MSDISFKILESIPVIHGRINAAIAEEANRIVKQGQDKIKRKIKQLAGEWVASQPEMVALSNNSLAAELGLRFGTAASAIDAIVISVKEATTVKVEKIDSWLRGGITLQFQPSNFANLLGLAQGHQKFAEGGDLHWLKWLLLEGHRMIVVDYHFEAEAGAGRSRGGVMTKGGAWRVPPQHAGVEDDNFITRAFSEREREITKVIEAAFS